MVAEGRRLNRNERREKVRKVVRRLHFSFSDLSLELSGVQHIKPETKDTQNLPIHLKDPFDHSDHSPPLTHPQTSLIPPKHSFQAWFPVYPPCVAFRGGVGQYHHYLYRPIPTFLHSTWRAKRLTRFPFFCNIPSLPAATLLCFQ